MNGFPIIDSKPAEAINWDIIRPHANQAMKNHGQTLERLAERGGLSWVELIAVLEDRPYEDMDVQVAIKRVADIVFEWEKTHK